MAPVTLSRAEIRPDDALLVVDLQYDFCPGGALAVNGGAEIVPIANALMPQFPRVVLTQDWHPKAHMSFASSHDGKQPFDTIMTSNGEQILWPDHCVQGTSGAALHRDLNPNLAALIIRKGMDPRIDSYSAFFENDRATTTGLTAYLRALGVTRVFLAGLALDFCIRYSAEDAVREGFEAIVIEDACRAIDTNGSLAAAMKSFEDLGIMTVRSSALTSARTPSVIPAQAGI